MEKLSSSSSIKLDDIIEYDEFYIKAGFKGRLYLNEIMKAVGRISKKRGLKPWNGRHGTFDKDQPMITYIHQRDGMTYFDVSSADKSLIDLFCKNVWYRSTVFAVEY